MLAPSPRAKRLQWQTVLSATFTHSSTGLNRSSLGKKKAKLYLKDHTLAPSTIADFHEGPQMKLQFNMAKFQYIIKDYFCLD